MIELNLKIAAYALGVTLSFSALGEVYWKRLEALAENLEEPGTPWKTRSCSYVWSQDDLRRYLLRLGYNGSLPDIYFDRRKGAVIVAPGSGTERLKGNRFVEKKNIEFRGFVEKGRNRFGVAWGYRNRTIYRVEGGQPISESTGDFITKHEILVVEVPGSARERDPFCRRSD